MADRKITRRQSGRPTIHDVAQLAKCSAMTVSRVMNNAPGVREDSRQAVEAAIAQLNYAPNKAARSLAGMAQIRIALLYTNPSDAYLSALLIGCLSQAGRVDAHLVVERCDMAADQEKVVARLIAAGVDGFLLPAPLSDDAALLGLLRRQRSHAVLIGTGRAEAHMGAVMIDDYQAAFDMTEHIIAQGHTRIGFIIGQTHQSISGLRLSGFREAMAAAGLPIDEALIRQGDFTYRSGFAAASQMLDLPTPPTAMFASNDDMAAGCVAAAQRKRLDVPRDLTVCGFDDTSIATKVWPELTTIRQPIHDMTQRAVELLAGTIRADREDVQQGPRLVVLDYVLVQRDSDAAAP